MHRSHDDIEALCCRAMTAAFPHPGPCTRVASKSSDANGQSLAYFYAHDNDHDANTAGVLTMDEARRMASNFARLPELLGRGGKGA